MLPHPLTPHTFDISYPNLCRPFPLNVTYFPIHLTQCPCLSLSCILLQPLHPHFHPTLDFPILSICPPFSILTFCLCQELKGEDRWPQDQDLLTDAVRTHLSNTQTSARTSERKHVHKLTLYHSHIPMHAYTQTLARTHTQAYKNTHTLTGESSHVSLGISRFSLQPNQETHH